MSETLSWPEAAVYAALLLGFFAFVTIVFVTALKNSPPPAPPRALPPPVMWGSTSPAPTAADIEKQIKSAYRSAS